MGRVQDKVIFITGAARGQGRANAVRLASEGSNIIGVDICEDVKTNDYAMATPEDLEETVRLVEAAGGRMLSTIADVRDREALIKAVEQGVAEFGRLDGVVANAGICPLGSDDPRAFMDAFTVDFNGVVNAIEAALPLVSEGGSIIAIGSLAALMPGTGENPAFGTGGKGYGLAKRMIASFVHDLATVVAPRKIRANVVHPTNCNTDMLHSDIMYRQFRPDLEQPKFEDAEAGFTSMSPMNIPFVEPEDISAMVLFLLSDESRYVSGMQMRVDAGSYVKLRPQPPQF